MTHCAFSQVMVSVTRTGWRLAPAVQVIPTFHTPAKSEERVHRTSKSCPPYALIRARASKEPWGWASSSPARPSSSEALRKRT